MFKSLSLALRIKKNDVISIVGCGGKTTIMFLIGKENLSYKILISTTTKILYPENEKVIVSDKNAISHIPNVGINILGNQDTNKLKLKSLKPITLDSIYKNYELIILESDGSKGLPLKGWNESEPVIFKHTTHTVGVITLNGLEKTVNDTNIHRVDEFIKNTGAHLGEKVFLYNICRMVTDKEGMFKNFLGKKILIINQVESLDDFNKAVKLKNLIIEDGFEIDIILTGSAIQNRWIELYRKVEV